MSGGTSGSNETGAAELEFLMNMESRVRSLEEKCNLIQETEEFQAQGKPLNRDQELLLCSKKRTHMLLAVLKYLLHNNQNQGVSAESHACSIKGMSGLNESGEMFNQPDVQQGNNERYLCICDGFAVHCLDLQSEHPFVVDESCSQLPLVDTLEFLENGLPVTAGLLKYGSDTYIVCGDEFSFGFKEENEIKNTTIDLYLKYGFRSSSRKICHLSLNDKKLSLYQCNNFPRLKKPKFLPIVEVIDREIHVVDTLPRRMVHNYIGPQVIPPSHEVLDVARCGLGWTEIPPINCSNRGIKGNYEFIREHLVVGNKMFARCFHREFVIFDPMKREWETMYVYENFVGLVVMMMRYCTWLSE